MQFRVFVGARASLNWLIFPISHCGRWSKKSCGNCWAFKASHNSARSFAGPPPCRSTTLDISIALRGLNSGRRTAEFCAGW